MPPEEQATITTPAASETPTQPAQATPPAETSLQPNSEDLRTGLFDDKPGEPVARKNFGESDASFFDDVPEDYKERPWLKELAKNANPKEALIKQVDHMQKMLGQKPMVAVPTADSPPEEIAAFRKTLGIPESPDKYTLENTAWSDEEKPFGAIIDKGRDPRIVKAVTESAHKHNIPPAALNGLINDFEKAQMQYQKAEIEALHAKQEAQGQDFRQLGTKYFGNNYPAVMSKASQAIAAYVQPEIAAMLPDLDNKSLMIIAAVTDGIFKRHSGEDRLAGRGGNSSMGSVSDMRTKALELMGKPEFEDKTSSTYKQVTDLWKEIDRLGA